MVISLYTVSLHPFILYIHPLSQLPTCGTHTSDFLIVFSSLPPLFLSPIPPSLRTAIPSPSRISSCTLGARCAPCRRQQRSSGRRLGEALPLRMDGVAARSAALSSAAALPLHMDGEARGGGWQRWSGSCAPPPWPAAPPPWLEAAAPRDRRAAGSSSCPAGSPRAPPSPSSVR